MTEIKNSNNLALNVGQIVSNVVQQAVNNTPVQIPDQSSLAPNEGKDISIKSAKSGNNTNLSFVEKTPVITGIAIGIAIPSNSDTKQLLSIGFSRAVELGQKAISGDKISIDGEPVTSIILTVAVRASRVTVMNPGNIEERKEAFGIALKTFEKMNNEKTDASSYNEEEKKFLWETASIKVEKNTEGKVDYFYYQTPESSPKKLSKQQITEIYSHTLNIVNDPDLFKTAVDIGKKLDIQITEAQNENKKDDKNNSKVEDKDPKKYVEPISANEGNKEKETKAGKVITLKEELNQTKSTVSENNFINSVTEQKKQEEKYHEKKVNEITTERSRKNQENSERLTEKTVNKIREEIKLSEK